MTASRGVDRLAALDDEVGAVGDGLVGHDRDGQAEAVLELGEMGALLVEDVERDRRSACGW